MKTMYLIRHGKVDNPQGIFYTADFPLGEQGTRQAQALAADIKDAGCDPTKIVSSPYVRTRETAEIISLALGGRSVETDDRLVEWQVGAWFGTSLETFRANAGYGREPFALLLKDVEQFEQASARVIAALHDILASVPERGCAIIVGHREPMVSAILALQGKTDWSDIPKLDFRPGAGWKLNFDGSRLVLASKAFDRSGVV